MPRQSSRCPAWLTGQTTGSGMSGSRVLAQIRGWGLRSDICRCGGGSSCQHRCAVMDSSLVVKTALGSRRAPLEALPVRIRRVDLTLSTASGRLPSIRFEVDTPRVGHVQRMAATMLRIGPRLKPARIWGEQADIAGCTCQALFFLLQKARTAQSPMGRRPEQACSSGQPWPRFGERLECGRTLGAPKRGPVRSSPGHLVR